MIDLRAGEVLDRLRELPDASVDAVITDPPYGLSDHPAAELVTALTAWVNGDRERVPDGKGFMGRAWDAFVPPPAVWDECYRVLKPGGHLLAFAGSRTYDLMGLSVRLAGFEIRDGLQWLYGSGFPKGIDVSKAIDKAAGATREVVGRNTTARISHGSDGRNLEHGKRARTYGADTGCDITAPATPEAATWDGWNTSLKPAHEPIVLARKPLSGTVAATVLEHGTGALNIGACRTGTIAPSTTQGRSEHTYGGGAGFAPESHQRFEPHVAGRWPTNVLLSHLPECGPEPEDGAAPQPCAPGCVVAELDAQSGLAGAAAPVRGTEPSAAVEPGTVTGARARVPGAFHGDTGGASRFYPCFRYCAKAPTRERPKIDGKGWPTVKPLALMRWLVRLVTPPGGTILDPFAGTGTTLQAAHDGGFASIGIERDPLALALGAQRLGIEVPALPSASPDTANRPAPDVVRGGSVLGVSPGSARGQP